jgi:AraC-like DNA-binding protein
MSAFAPKNGHRLEGNGMAFGAKLQPGALRAFGVIEPWRLRDAAVPASSPFRGCWSIYHEDRPRVLAAEVEAHLIALQPRHDSLSLKASEIAQIAEDNLNISSVASLADRLGLSQRSVQEICHRGLGVHPKWLIRCFRLQDAALRLEAKANVSLPGLAKGLGYFDQAHFTRDFKRATGVSPGRYRLSAHAGAEASA